MSWHLKTSDILVARVSRVRRWGLAMASDLQVDANGLRGAASASGDIASSLANGQTRGTVIAQPSGAGVDAMNAAVLSLQGRQSSRIAGQAGDLTVGGSTYERTDSEGAHSITTVPV